MRTRGGLPSRALILCAIGVFPCLPGQSTQAFAQITNVNAFVEQCPTLDPAYDEIRSDFIIRVEGEPVGILPCSGPWSTLPLSELTDSLIAVQLLRILYYMDRGRVGHVPWTSGTLYQWMKSKIRGINFKVIPFNATAYCCDVIGGERYIVISPESDWARNLRRSWARVSGRIGLFVHETRHVDGYPHDPVCVSCDTSYDPADPGAYGVNWWLEAALVVGQLNVGWGCLSPGERLAIAEEHLRRANFLRDQVFVTNPPPLLAMPAEPGGPCAPGLPGPPTNVQATVLGSRLLVQWTAPHPGVGVTGYRVVVSSGGVEVGRVAVGATVAAEILIPAGVRGQFQVTVIALAGSAESAPSAPVTITIGSACVVPPAAPTGVTGAIAGGVATISWSPSPEAVSYVVQAGGVPGASDLYNADVGALTSVSASGLPPGFRAYVRILAVNTCGPSTPSVEFLLQ